VRIFCLDVIFVAKEKKNSKRKKENNWRSLSIALCSQTTSPGFLDTTNQPINN